MVKSNDQHFDQERVAEMRRIMAEKDARAVDERYGAEARRSAESRQSSASPRAVSRNSAVSPATFTGTVSFSTFQMLKKEVQRRVKRRREGPDQGMSR